VTVPNDEDEDDSVIVFIGFSSSLCELLPPPTIQEGEEGSLCPNRASKASKIVPMKTYTQDCYRKG